MAEGVPPIGMTRVGLHVGDAIVGNFGGEDRIQYTALGDSMNTASRLESANKSLKTGILISAEAAASAGRDDLVPMGRVTLRGRARPVEAYPGLVRRRFRGGMLIGPRAGPAPSARHD